MASLSFCISLTTFLLYFSLLLVSCFTEESQGIGNHFHSVDVTSLLASSACTRHQASTGSNTTKYSTTLEVVHMNGPCSRDQSRVDSIHARPNQKLLPNQCKDSSKASLPFQYGNGIEYAVTVGLGTPQQNVTLLLDTGSSLTWTQCKPCAGHCYKQRGPVYNPLSSSTYSIISCDSSQCSNLDYNLYCYTGPCVYSILYSDGSDSIGPLSQERLTITPTTDNVFPNFLFGCGQKNRGQTSFGEAAGILGLGKNAYSSFVYQTEAKYGKCFAYCFPSTVSSTGYLAFGSERCNNIARNVKFTPLIPHPQDYHIEIVAISLGGTKLPINQSVFHNPGTIIDSGTDFTYLPMDAYVVMRDAFKKKIGNLYPSAPAFLSLDTCYKITNHANIQVPHVSFTFGGGVEVELEPSGIIYVVNSTLACFAFAGNTDPNDVGVFGIAQQKTFEVVYDVAREGLAFVPRGCK